MEKIDNLLKIDYSKRQLTSGFDDLDNIIHSFDASNLYILAGGPSMGKTSLGLTLIYQLSKIHDACLAVISYEMDEYQLVSRLLAISSNIPNHKIINENLEKSEMILLSKKKAELASTRIFLDCPSTLDFKFLKSKIMDLKNKHNIEFLLIDDIQRITISEDDRKYASNREQEVSRNVRDLKALAKQLGTPIMAISQLNRDHVKRVGKRPILTDFRDSGSIENDSDVIIFIHRPEYFGITEDEEGDSLRGIAFLEVAKNRHGNTGEIQLHFNKNIPTFYTFDKLIPY